MPGSLDFAGMLAALEGRRAPAPRHPLDDLAEVAAVAQQHLSGFLAPRPDAPKQPVAPRGRRPGR
ncbi:hypothetical protein [Patulibacter sp. SYSU D01012]|uniref:hypothetical protein n=1 Tax=Patulibacter sp. SYSU D01012 TaxID=2817381 RepID=UPI001B313A80|nr:hypothetical protein [Patulibacter sp. SYSU D01012]